MRPRLIFLDEPTSGLDSFSAATVVRKLVSLSRSEGCNVLCTIHQPASEVFHTFNRALLLYKGKVASLPQLCLPWSHSVPLTP
jgi:ABC-type multidrug transport system ATPase subunit